jgi:tetratricopeptide (TPR) repeat protein
VIAFQEWLKRFWKHLVAFLSTIAFLVEFVQYWRGDRATVTLVAAALGWLVASAFLGYMAFSKRPLHIQTLQSTRVSRLYRYSRRIRIAAIVGLSIFIFLPSIYGVWLYRCDLKERSKFVVLVANFCGPDPETYQVTQEVLDQVSAALKGYNDTVVRSLDTTIPDEERAHELGRTYNADLFLWGRYALTESAVRLWVHVEDFTESKAIPFSPSGDYPVTVPLEELKSFEFQQRLGGEMSALALFVSGIVRYSIGDYPEAIRRLDAARKPEIWPETLLGKEYLFYYIGNAHLFMGDLTHAIASYEQAIEINDQFAKAHHNRGVACVFLGRYEEAIEDFDAAIENASDSEFIAMTAHYVRGCAYAALGEDTKAITNWGKVVGYSPRSAEAHLVRGWAYINLGDYAKAVEDLDAAIRNTSNSQLITAAHYYRGCAYAALGEDTKAITNWGKAVGYSPRSAEAHLVRGGAYINLGDYAKAVEDFDAAIRNTSNSQLITAAHYYRGCANIYLGENAKAVEDFDAAIENTSDSQLITAAHYHRGCANINLGENVKAVEDFDAAIENAVGFEGLDLLHAIDNAFVPDLIALAYLNRGCANINLGENAKAVEDFDAAIENTSDSELIGTAYYYQGLAYDNLGYYGQTITNLPARPLAQGEGFYTLSQGECRVQVAPLAGPLSAVGYYNLADGHLNTGLEEANTAVLFLYRDTITGTVSLFVLLSGPGGTAGTMALTLSGVPVGADFLVKDNQINFQDVWEITPPTGSVSWAWDETNSDGMVLGPLGPEFELGLYPQFTSGITAVKFLSGDIASPEAISLNLIDLIIVQGMPSMLPVVTFTVSPAEPHINEPVTFDASGSSDPDGTITSYDWDFDGDGLFDLSTEDPVATHSYSTSGFKDVTLRVTDTEGTSARYTYAFDVFP